jgi:hypothetical protein
MPDWIVCAFLALTFARSVRSIIGGRLSALRILRCGLGMGGPASPFLWNLAYDPIVVGLADACIASCPTYVDDLAGLAVGPVQTMRLLVLMLVVGHAAGLRTDVHTCS